MVNILLPFMGKSNFFQDSFFPKPLVEIKGKTMLEMVAENYNSISDRQYIYIFSEDGCNEFHMDDSVRILDDSSIVIKLRNETAGALCTCMMAVDYINNDIPLIISNSDQIIDVDYMEVLRCFEEQRADAGIITFPDIHPRWSYAKEKDGEIIEVAEKRPLSKKAIAGFYYFKHGKDYIESAKSVLFKRNSLNGQYYISATLNEMILQGKKIGYYDIEKTQYHSFYSPEKILEYER